ncbi:hypothetical protein V8F33_013888 [Rhypophila sp. PSN 637]
MAGVWEDANEKGEVVIGILCVDGINNEKDEAVIDILCVDICLDTAPESIQILSLRSPRHMRAIWDRLRMLKNQLQVQEGGALFQRICEAYDKGDIGENDYRYFKEKAKVAIEKRHMQLITTHHVQGPGSMNRACKSLHNSRTSDTRAYIVSY